MAIGCTTWCSGLTSLARGPHRLLVEEPMAVHTLTLALLQTTTVYRCRDLTFTYPAGSGPALEGVSSASSRACSASLVAPGSGKSTSVRCCCALPGSGRDPSSAGWTSTA